MVEKEEKTVSDWSIGKMGKSSLLELSKDFREGEKELRYRKRAHQAEQTQTVTRCLVGTMQVHFPIVNIKGGRIEKSILGYD